MSKVPADAALAIQIQDVGANLIRKSCVEALGFAKKKFSAPGVNPSRKECQEVYRFFAATALVWIGRQVPNCEYLRRFQGIEQTVQTANCLEVCRMENISAEVGGQLFQATWSEMFDDTKVADECLHMAAKTGQSMSFTRAYPVAYFERRHGYKLLEEIERSIRFGASIITLDVIQETGETLNRIEATYAQHFK